MTKKLELNERYEIGPVFCAIHYVNEMIYSDTHQVCYECKHVFQTEQELVEATRLLGNCENNSARVGELIYSCPECLHDF
jgi:hypothetical protein